MSGINFVVFFIIAYVIYGSQPQVGASAEELAAFYDGDRTRILIAAVVAGLAVLNLLWFAAGAQDHRGGCGARRLGRGGDRLQRGGRRAVPLALTVGAALAYSIAGSGNSTLTSGLNDFAWAGVVVTSADDVRRFLETQ